MKADSELIALFEATARNVEDTARLLRRLVADYPDHASLADDILRREHDGDRLVHDILHRIAVRGTGGALDPADVHALAGALDDIVDHAEEAADQLGLYGVEAPMDAAEAIADVLVRSTRHVAAAVHGLSNGGDLGADLVEVHRLENEGDRLVRAAVASLFVDGIDPMTVIRWKDIFETLEAAVDACETAANVLEGMVLKVARR
jgi:uncharacterized protein Yka (UPF0111/DUF47 family)